MEDRLDSDRLRVREARRMPNAAWVVVATARNYQVIFVRIQR